MQSLKDKVVLITGSSSGIGAASALKFAECGSKLVLSGRNQERLDQVATQCQEMGIPKENVVAITGPIEDQATRKSLVQTAIDRYGQIDVLVNNAAIQTGVGGPFFETTHEQFDKLMDVNVWSVVELTQLAVPHLIKSKGSIVNVSSICSTRPLTSMMVYNMTKAAIDSFTECLTLELGEKGVRVNAVLPGSINTPAQRTGPRGVQLTDEQLEQKMESRKALHPLGRVGSSEEVADAILFLASDQSKFVSGQKLFVDGGRHCRT